LSSILKSSQRGWTGIALVPTPGGALGGSSRTSDIGIGFKGPPRCVMPEQTSDGDDYRRNAGSMFDYVSGR
jgi:hypothetical protein